MIFFLPLESPISPTAQKALTPPSGLGVFCNGSSSAPSKGGFSNDGDL